MEINELKRKVDEIRNQNLKMVLYKSNAYFDIPVKEDLECYEHAKLIYSSIGMDDCTELSMAISRCSITESETEKEDAKFKLAEEMVDVLLSIEKLKRLYDIDDELINDIYNVKFNRYLDLIEIHKHAARRKSTK